MRQETGDMRQHMRQDMRHGTGDRKCKTGNGRWESGNWKWGLKNLAVFRIEGFKRLEPNFGYLYVLKLKLKLYSTVTKPVFLL